MLINKRLCCGVIVANSYVTYDTEHLTDIMRLQVKSGIATLLLMSFTVGYCDTITFFTSGFFSVHVVANVIFSAHQFLHNNIAKGISQLLSIPVYLGALFASRRLLRMGSKRMDLIKLTGVILMAAGLLYIIFIIADTFNSQLIWLFLDFLVVFAMGTFGAAKYKSTSEFHLMDSIVPAFWAKGLDLDNRAALMVLVGFVAGCASGAVAANFVGLGGVMLPGVLLLLFTMNDE